MLRSVACVAPIVAIMASAFAHPPVFSDVSFADAKKANATNGKYLLIKGTAVWCGPCKKMDKTTWVDDQVVAWVKANGVAIALDVDEHPDDAQSLKIEAMPTMIIMKEGKELDRVVGYRDAEQLLAWVKDVQAGKTTAARVKEKAGKRAGADGSVDIQARLELARDATQANQFDVATDEYLWLWDNMLEFERGYSGVRLSFMVSDMQRLAQRHAPMKEAFLKKRDALEAKLKDRTAKMDTLVDWAALNEVVDDQARTLAWYDRVKDDPEAKAEIDRLSSRLVPMLEREKRWKEVGQLVDMQSLTWMLDDRMASMPKPEQMSDAEFRSLLESLAQRQRERLAAMHAHLLAAGRDADAATLASKVLAKDDSAAMRRAFVAQAVAIDVARASMTTWLDEADKADPKGEAKSDALRGTLPKE